MAAMCSVTAELWAASRLDLADEPQGQTFLSCHFEIFKHGTKGLEHLYTWNNINSLKGSANLSVVLKRKRIRAINFYF